MEPLPDVIDWEAYAVKGLAVGKFQVGCQTSRCLRLVARWTYVRDCQHGGKAWGACLGDSVNLAMIFLARPPFNVFAGLFGYEQPLNLVVNEIQAHMDAIRLSVQHVSRSYMVTTILPVILPCREAVRSTCISIVLFSTIQNQPLHA